MRLYRHQNRHRLESIFAERRLIGVDMEVGKGEMTAHSPELLKPPAEFEDNTDVKIAANKRSLDADQAAALSGQLRETVPAAPSIAVEAKALLADLRSRYENMQALSPVQEAARRSANRINLRIATALDQPLSMPQKILDDARSLESFHALMEMNASGLEDIVGRLPMPSPRENTGELGAYRPPANLRFSGPYFRRGMYYPPRPLYGSTYRQTNVPFLYGTRRLPPIRIIPPMFSRFPVYRSYPVPIRPRPEQPKPTYVADVPPPAPRVAPRVRELPLTKQLSTLAATHASLSPDDPKRAEIRQQYVSMRQTEIMRGGKEVYIIKDGAIEKGIVRKDAGGGLEVWNSRERWSVPMPDSSQIWLAAELEGLWNIDGLVDLPVEAQFKQRQFDYLNRNATLSKLDYIKLFAPDMKQRTGNCYLIALFRSLQESDIGETLIRTSVKVVSPGKYSVRIPLGTGNTWYPVNASDIDDNVAVQPVKASEGWKILEAAYLSVDPRSQGSSSVSIARFRAEGGNSDKAAKLFIGGIDTTFEGDINMSLNQNPSGMAKVTEKLNTFSNGRDFLVAGSMYGPSDKQKYDVDGTDFFYGHAYTVRSVDAKNRTITLWEPNNTRRDIVISYDTFMKAFRFLHGGKVDYSKMFS